jgi:serine/threonine-protein kinase
VRTSTGALKGTFAYMAPEQLRGQRVDRRTDVFAMGIVMWETLTRRHLFKRDTEFLTFEAITTDPIEDVRAIRPDVPPALSQVIMTALARDRDGRFPTARALGEAVAAAIQPFSAAVISDELVRAFPGELAAQAALIRIAREGGVLDLDVERGPSVAHGAHLLTTLISQPPAQSESVREPSVRELSVHTISAQPPPVGGVAPMIAAPAAVAVAMPIRRSWRPLAIAALAGAIGGAGAFVYGRVVREPARVAREAPARAKLVEIEHPDAAVSAEAASPASSVAAPAARSTAVPPIVAPHNAASAAAEPAPAAAPTAVPAKPAQPGATTPVRPAGRSVKPPAPAAVKPSDQPGFITIDSSPVYAVIYIDDRNYGETPLVRRALPPGVHVVHAVAPSGATRDVRITIESGKVAPAKRIIW